MWPIELYHRLWPCLTFKVMSTIFAENKCSLLLQSLIESPGDLVKDNIVCTVSKKYSACYVQSQSITMIGCHSWTVIFTVVFLPIFLYGLDCWAISKTDTHKIDALDQCCLRMLLGIRWYQFVWNDDVWRLMKQPKLTAIIQSRRLTLFGHIMRMDDNADAKRILLASRPAEWRRTRSSPHHVA